MIKRTWMFLALAIFIVSQADAQEDGFLVRDIRVEGNQRITDGNIFNYLPINVGDVMVYYSLKAKGHSLELAGWRCMLW